MHNQSDTHNKDHRVNLMNSSSSFNSQRGTLIIMAALSLVTILSFGALAVDIGYAYVARNEIQNTADTAALNGARFLYPFIGKEPDWVKAEIEANAVISSNKVANLSLTTGNIETGYWNITGSTIGLRGTAIGDNDLAAVKVTLDTQSNNSPVTTFFAKIFGVDSIDVSATAVAVVAAPISTPKGLFPIVINQCMFDQFYNDDGSLKSINPSSNESTVFKLASNIHNTGCPASQWTSMKTGNKDVPTVRQLIDIATGKKDCTESNKIDCPLPEISIGTEVWIQPGTKATLYDYVNDCSAAGDKSCEYVLTPVVCSDINVDTGVCNDIDLPDPSVLNNSWIPITNFACLHILCAVGGNNPDCTVDDNSGNSGNRGNSGGGKGNNDHFFIKAQMVPMTEAGIHPNCKINGTGGGAPSNGVVLPPKLANYSGNTY